MIDTFIYMPQILPELKKKILDCKAGVDSPQRQAYNDYLSQNKQIEYN